MRTRIVAYLKSQPGATNVGKSIKSGTSKIVFVPDEQKLASMELSPDVTGFWLRLFATGVKVDSIRVDKDSKDKEDITLRLSSATPDAADITSISIPTQAGLSPLASLGKLTLEPNPTLITREDGKRTISVTAGVKSGYTVPQVNAGTGKSPQIAASALPRVTAGKQGESTSKTKTPLVTFIRQC